MGRSSTVVGLAVLVLAACGGSGSSGAGSTPPSTRAAGGAASSAASAASGPRSAGESAFEKAEEDVEKELSPDTRVFVPKGWLSKRTASGWAFEEPEHELGITLVAVEADSHLDAVTKAWARLGKTPPPKVDATETSPDVDGWDELGQTAWEIPVAERRLVVMTVRRKGNRAFVFLIDGKLSALGRRGAQLRQITGGLKLKGVEAEDVSTKPVLALDAERIKSFETFIESARAKSGVPGVAVAVVQDGKIVFEKGFGTKRHGKSDPVGPKTKFMIGSVTKSLSTLLIAKLVDEGKVKWDSPVSELLPSFQTGDPAFTKQLTLWHTFCACTGMPRRDLDLVFEFAKVKPDDVLGWFSKMKPTTGFGETFQYSNQMTTVGGFVAARIAEPGKPLAAAYAASMKSRIFGPMGMTDSTASFDEGRQGNVASPHSVSFGRPYGEPQEIPIEIESFVAPVAPAGAIFSSVHDMARYALVELAEGKTPEGKTIVSSANLLERRKPRVKMSAKSAYGLGLIDAKILGMQVVTHDGGTFGFASRFAVVPSKNVGLVVLTNKASTSILLNAIEQRWFELMLGAKERAARDLDRDVEDERRELTKEQEKQSKAMPETFANAIAGTWQNERLGTMTITAAKGTTKPRANVGEWSTTLGYAKSDEGTESAVFLDPPVPGMPLRVDGDALVIAFGQDTFRFTRQRERSQIK